MRVGVVIVASGKGLRMGQTVPKQFIDVGGKTILEYSLDFFHNDEATEEIILVLPADEMTDRAQELKSRYGKIREIVSGGKERIDSVRNGVLGFSSQMDIVAVHDGVRPFVSTNMWRRLLTACEEGALAVVPAIPVKDTIKRVRGTSVLETLDRSELRAIQTPQVFGHALLRDALQKPPCMVYTDEASLMEAWGQKVQIVSGDEMNRKITEPEDLAWMKSKVESPEMRIGTGYDVHKLVTNRKLILGGVEIPHEKGLFAHSDGDVLVHALMDALLGALGYGDIGMHFPDNDMAYKDVSSLELLRKVAKLLYEADYELVNADMSLIAERPKLMPHRDQMMENIAKYLGVDKKRIGVKATTTEGLGFCGREEGIACQAVCCIRLKSNG
jgi:2-C-methyl-D-erythritol 2,4-cyclodiphosphate synthase/2-C-methyl-D-erythritol 4-phosphate cytidylyltransferase